MLLGLVSNKLRSFALFFILLQSSRGFYTNVSLVERAEIIRCVSEYINDHSIILISSKSDNLDQEFRLEKIINHPFRYYTGVWNFKTITRNLYSDDFFPANTLIVVKYTLSNIKELSLISKKINMASFDWLLLSSLDDINELDFGNIEIPFNCRFIVSTKKKERLIALEEIYQISRNSSIVINHFGFWNRERGLHNVGGEMFSRRMNLKGHTFKFGVHNVSGDVNPCSLTSEIDNGRTIVQCSYYEIWKDMGFVLNYTTDDLVIEDCYQNSSTGLSTPMLETIRVGGTDSGVDGYIWSSSRLKYNQFLWPLLNSKVILLTKIPSRKFSFSSYVGPFVGNMWFALIGWLLLSGTIANLIIYVSEKTIYKKKLSFHNEHVENLFVPFTAICYQGTASIPKETAIRISYLMIYLIPVVFIPSYSGSVISSLSVPSENIPFNDIAEFVKDGSYQLTAVNNTFFQLILMTDERLEPLRQKKLISTEMPPSYRQGFIDVCSKKLTLMFEKPVLTKNTIDCNVFILDQTGRKIFSSMAVRKNFPFIEIFNRQIQKLVATGLNMKILQNNALNIYKYDINTFHENYFQLKPFEFDDVLPLFTILLGGILMSIVFLALECQLGQAKKLDE